jgi:hypothetical protein
LGSSNNSWLYSSEFTDSSGIRPGSWIPSLVKSSNSYDEINKTDYYTANQGTYADPVIKMGMMIKAWQYGQTWKAENGDVRWQFYNPLGIYQASASGYKYREKTNWATRANLGKSKGSSSYEFGWAVEATPTTAATWQAWSQSNVSMGGSYTNLQYRFAGSLSAIEDNAIYYQVDSMTLKFTTANVPTVSLASETTNAQLLDAKLTNLSTGDWISININLGLGDYIYVDTDLKEVGNASAYILSALTKSNKKDWFDLVPGTNSLLFELENPGSLELYIAWEERKA